MIKIPTPEEVLSTLDRQEQLDFDFFVNGILKELTKFNGKPLKIVTYKKLTLKCEKKVKELFDLHGWKMSLQSVSDQRDGDYTCIVLEAKV